MRLASTVLIVASLTLSMPTSASTIPFDPQILIATGGDATDITNAGNPITVGPNGGGIFVFHNGTGLDLLKLVINLDFHSVDPVTVNGTIVAPPSPVRQRSTFSASQIFRTLCNGMPSDTTSCLILSFMLTPGPLIAANQNFILDFNNPDNYTDADLAVIDGTYTGGDMPNGTGDWAPGGFQATGTFDVFDVPEPASFGTTVLCLAGLLKARRLLRQRNRRSFQLFG